MFLTMEKFNARVKELEERRYQNRVSIAPFIAMEGQLQEDETYHVIPGRIDGKLFGLNDIFQGRDKYLWLQRKVLIPDKTQDCEVVGLFNFGETGGGNNSGFESLLYVDGHPWQGVDSNHQEVLFSGKEGKEVTLTFLLWTGLEGGGKHRTFYHQCKQADIAFLHRKTDELYYFARAITATLPLLDTAGTEYELLKQTLDRTLLLINWDEESFYESVDAAHEYLMHAIDQMEKNTDTTVYTVGHTHIDVAWLWRLKHTREKAQRSFATVLRLMENYDEYIFLQTQPQLYKYIKNDCPEIYAGIKEKVREGKWEPDGGMWVEADCNLSSGEALVRQFLHGTRFFEQEFGKKCEYLWLPDVFGYSWALPQILKLCEINTFMTTKISWNQFNTIPNDLFWWRGIDGSEILTYFVTTPDEGHDITTRYSTYNGMLTPHTVLGNWKKFKNKNLSRSTLVSYGFGDGGGGVNRDMLEMRRAMDKIPGLPHVKPLKAGEFFDKLHESVEHTDQYVHTWDGELYLEYHRGTYTSQAYNKKTNRSMENRLAQIEWLSSVAYALGGEYAQEQLHDAWECVLLHQFHDIIPGSSIHEVYQDSRKNYAAAGKLADEAKETALQTLREVKENHYTIYTTNSFAGDELVKIPLREACEEEKTDIPAGHFETADQTVLEAQRYEDGYEVLVKTEPFAAVEIVFVPDEKEEILSEDSSAAETGSVPGNWEQQSPFCDSRTLETPYYIIAWNEDGQICRIYDKEADREILEPGKLANVFEIYEDKPLNYDAWDIDIFHTQKMEVLKPQGMPEMIQGGPLKTVLRSEYDYHHSHIVQDMMVYRDSRRIDFVTHVDWHEDHRLLKTAFYTDIRSPKATYDIQFGHVERPTHWNTSWDWARFEVCGHKWSDLSENGYGVSLLNDCKYGHSIKDRVMRLSLLKSAKTPDTEADMGKHDFIYSLYPHCGNVTEGGTIEEANSLNLPAQVLEGSFKNTAKLVRVEKINAQQPGDIQIDVVKKAEDENCLVVRTHECKGGRVQAKLLSEYPVKKIVPCNLLEHDCGEAVIGSCTEAVWSPFEIKTFKIYL